MDINSQLKLTGYNKSQFWKPFEEKPEVKSSKKLIAYYLPQFHAIPENDINWGKGFTEWRNVSRSLPIFSGHYQPRMPADLGYYDLTTPGVINEQAKLARNYGIYGWALYYYWFDSKRLLSKPIDIIYENRSIDINYCVFWTNENWTKSWDGQNNNILVGQNHSPEDDIRFIAEVSKYFSDPRYIRYQGKPVLMVYRPKLFPNILETVERWKNWCMKNNVPTPYLINSEVFGYDAPQNIGFDAAAEFPPHQGSLFKQDFLRIITSGFNIFDTQRVFSCYTYESYINACTYAEQNAQAYKVFKCVFPDWDNSSRRPDSPSTMFNGSTPELYKRWLTHCINKADKDDLVFINAWNEWAEGAYLEPDLFNGHAYLNATWQAIQESADNK